MSDTDGRSRREQELDAVLAAYLEAASRAPQRPTEWVARYPQFGTEIDAFISNYAGVSAHFQSGPKPSVQNPIAFGTDFQLLAELGAGGMGVVYRAHQISLDRVVALKTIRAGRLASAEERRRFGTEARAAARLRHPHIVTVHGAGECDGQLYLCMEFVDGRGLDQVIQDAPLAPVDGARCLAAAARAVQFAHERGVLHRDLKPSNILIDDEGRPKLADFGLARLTGQHSGDTVAGEVFGTPAYMSPEQAEGRHADIGPASDVYSLGAVLYELLTGRPPFRGTTQAETIWKVLHAEPVPPHLVNAGVPAELEAICLRALEKDPRHRYLTAHDLAEDVQRFVDGEPVLTRAVNYPERLWRRYNIGRSRHWSRLNVASAGLVIGVVLATLIGLAPHLGLWGFFDAAHPKINTMAAIAALMTVWWVTEAMPLAATALVPLALFPLFGIMGAGDVAAHYGKDVVFLFLGGMLIALAVEESGLSQRLARHLVSHVGPRPRRTVGVVMLVTAGISMWLSNTATVLIMLPVAFSVLLEMQSGRDDHHDKNFAKALMIGVAYAASIGGTATPAGTFANQAFLRNQSAVGFVDWMAFGMPFAMVMSLAAWLLLVRMAFPIEAVRNVGRQRTSDSPTPVGRFCTGERRILAIALGTAVLWLWRGLADPSFRPDIKEGTIAMSMALLCFLVPSGREPGGRLLEWRTTQRVPWAVMFLFGGGLALAAGVTSSGLGTLVGHRLAALLEEFPNWTPARVLLASMFSTVATQLTPSNLSTVDMVLPALRDIGAPVTLLAAATLAASCDFLFPWSTPPNAIVYVAARLTLRDMFKAGIWITLLGILLTVICVTLAFAFLI